MALRKVTTFPFPQCPLPQRRHVRDKASFRQELTRERHATIAKNLDLSKTNVENSKERRNKNAMKARVPKKSTQSARLVTKQTTRRSGVGKAQEPTSSPKPSNWTTPNPKTQPQVMTTPIIRQLLLSLKAQKTRFATALY